MPRKSLPSPPHGYDAFLKELKERIRLAQVKAALAVNKELIILYWQIGTEILQRQEAEGWGSKIISQIAQDLKQDFPDLKGFSTRNLKYMRSFAKAWPDKEFVHQLGAQIPWKHNCVVIEKVKENSERQWYIQQTIDNGWSRSVLTMQIESNLYQRLGGAVTNFERTLPQPQSDLAQQIIKDPYCFDFLTDSQDELERELERGLIEHIRDFLLELGVGFAFLGSQYPIRPLAEIRAIFYHSGLKALI